MAIVDLPILALTTSVKAAGDAMWSNRVSAVVVVQDRKHFVITADDMHDAIVQAGDQGDALTLADIANRREATSPLTIGSDGIEIGTFRPPPVTKFSLAVNDGLLRSFMASQPSAVGILQTGQIARVVTFDDTFEIAINRTITRGTCRDPQKHRWYDYELTKSPYCNLDPTFVDF